MQNKSLGCYGIIIDNNKILLVDKNGGPYDSKLDLPGGQFQFGERPIETLKREMKEEVGITVTNMNLLDVDSVYFDRNYHSQLIKVHHIAIFYEILDYYGEIKEKININKFNDDSKGAKFYEINKLRKNNLSKIALLILEKLGYKLK